ncbi:tetratricopeptide repeat protein [Pseudomonas fluorescens]|uniref:tetratricopeptide repeat protein n=1 Tax=Pseudomonas fluorescens TaxID=294 RepID=UPI003F9D64B3
MNGGNFGTIINNDTDQIKSALTDVMTRQAEVRSLGVEGELQSEIGRQIDQYRDLMNSGRVKEAYDLYSELLIHQAKNLQPISIFRIKANIGICNHLLGRPEEAARLLLEAYTYAPDDQRAIAFKAFAFILQNKNEDAIQYGLKELERDPNNETLADFVLQATRIHYQYSDCFEDPYERFSDELKQSKSVRLAHIHLLASQNCETWRALADEYLREEPDSLLAKTLVALGIVQAFVDERQSKNGYKFSAADVQKIKVAAGYFGDYWEDFKRSDRLANGWDLQVIQGLIISYKLSGNHEKLRELCAHALSEFSEDQGLIDTTVKCLLDLDEPQLCLEAIGKLDNHEDARKLRFLLLVAQKDWGGLSSYQDYQLAKFEGDFLSQAKIVCLIARARKGDSTGKLKLVELLSTAVLDSRSRLLLFEFSCASGIKIIAEIAYDYGSKLINDQTDVIEFFHYMKLARSLMMWKEIVVRLSVHPDVGENYELKHMLALAFINEHPLRAEAVHFFEELALDPSGFEMLLGIYYCKRNVFEEARRYIAQYYSSGGADLYGFLVLIDMAKNERDIEALSELFTKYDTDQFDGPPEQWMHVARALVMIGDSKKGLELAYRLRAENPKVSIIALGYFHVFLKANKDVLLDDSLAVSGGCHIRLVCSDNTIIERDVSETIEDDLSLNPEGVDPYVKKVLGEKPGFEYEQEKLQGPVKWRLAEVKHKYLDAFHNVCSTYESEFPEAGGLWTIKVEDGNVQALLDLIKRQAERDEDFITTVVEKNIPLGIAAGMWGKNVFQVSDLIRVNKGSIHTCLGTAEERDRTIEIVRAYKGKAIVLDTYSVWVAAELGLLESLTGYFDTVMVSQSSLESVRALVRQTEELEGSEFSLGWRGGAFIKSAFTEAELTEEVRRLAACAEAIGSQCKVVHFDFPSGLDELTELLLEISPETIEPYFLAKEHDALLISDDGFSRGFAKNAYELSDSAWLQSFVNEALNDGIISPYAYVEAILGLCRLKHSSVSISTYVMQTVFEQDSTLDLVKFRMVCEYIGGPSAEEKSHFDLVLRFIVRNWLLEYNSTNNPVVESFLLASHGNAFPSAKVKKATSMLLERIRLMPDGVRLLNELASYPILRLKGFIVDWWSGHFYR